MNDIVKSTNKLINYFCDRYNLRFDFYKIGIYVRYNFVFCKNGLIFSIRDTHDFFYSYLKFQMTDKDAKEFNFLLKDLKLKDEEWILSHLVPYEPRIL